MINVNPRSTKSTKMKLLFIFARYNDESISYNMQLLDRTKGIHILLLRSLYL